MFRVCKKSDSTGIGSSRKGWDVNAKDAGEILVKYYGLQRLSNSNFIPGDVVFWVQIKF